MGVDEAGRGPLAGPVAAAAVMVPEGFDVQREFPGVNDSKLLTPQKRKEIYQLVLHRAERGDLRFCVRFSDHLYIDRFGITRAVRRSVWNGVRTLAPRQRSGQAPAVKILLDGLLQAPRGYAQETIVGGDRSMPLISLASVIAKVRRDTLMRRMAKAYPQYGFELHKGYGTKRHWAAISQFGLCEIHRRTYCLPARIAETPAKLAGKAGKVNNTLDVIAGGIVECA